MKLSLCFPGQCFTVNLHFQESNQKRDICTKKAATLEDMYLIGKLKPYIVSFAQREDCIFWPSSLTQEASFGGIS